MNQYIVVFPTSGDNHRDYSYCDPLALEKSIVLNYSNLQNLTWRLSNNRCDVNELFIPTIIWMQTYFLCGTLEAVKEKAIAWRQTALPLVTLPLYLVEVPLCKIVNSRFLVAEITQISEIKVQIFPQAFYKVTEKWRKPTLEHQGGRQRTHSTSSLTVFVKNLFHPRDRAGTH